MMPNDSTGGGDGSSRKRASLEEMEISPSKKHVTMSDENSKENEAEVKESELKYRCFMCKGATFSNEKKRTRHQLSHFVSTTTMHCCQHCRELFDTKDKFQRHITETHLEKMFSCSTCHNMFEYCSVCFAVFESRNGIDSHFMDKYMNEMKIFRCLGCPDSTAVYYSEDELAEHVHSAHFYITDKQMVLNDLTVGDVGSSRKRSSLEGMEISPSKKHATMSDEKSNEYEAEVKESELQYRCLICKVATFSNEKELTQHKFSHFVSTTTMHRCQHCYESFDTSDKFQSHITDTHLQQLYSCTVCHNVVEYCSLCYVVFNSRKGIDTHFVAKHKVETKSFRCLVCPDSSTSSEDELIEHVNSAHFYNINKQMIPNDSTVGGEGSSRKISSLEGMDISQLGEHATTMGEMSNESESVVKESELQYSCSICNVATFSNEKEVKRHLFSHFISTITRHYCKYCRDLFDTSDKFQSHMMDTHFQKTYGCFICSKLFPSMKDIHTHFVAKHRDETESLRCLGCPDSSMIYCSEDELAEHVNSAHFYNIDKQMMPNDSTVGSESKKGLSLEGTEISQSKKYATTSGEKSNENESEVKEFELQYQCSFCNVITFSNEKELMRHKFNHYVSTTTMHCCQHCRESFDTSDKFQMHMIDRHLRKLYICPACNLELNSRNGVYTHFVNIHKGEIEVFGCLGCSDSPIIYYSENELAIHVNSEHIPMAFVAAQLSALSIISKPDNLRQAGDP